MWQKVTSEVQQKIAESCKRRGISCVVQQKTAAPAEHSDPGLMEDLHTAILASQEVGTAHLAHAKLLIEISMYLYACVQSKEKDTM